MTIQGTKPPNTQGTKPPSQHGQPHKSFKETDDFQQFQRLLENGFVAPGTALPHPELLAFSEKLARVLRRSEHRDTDTAAQLGAFFKQVNGLKYLHPSPEQSTQLQVELRMLRARVLYAAGRRTISREASIVIQESLDRLLARDDLTGQIPGFCGFFEALYAYYYYQAQKDARRRSAK
jgi:CRISPR type III-A-associated protein Csm2